MFPGRLQVTGIIRKKTKQKQRCALLGCRGSAAYPDCGPRDGPLWAVQFRIGFRSTSRVTASAFFRSPSPDAPIETKSPYLSPSSRRTQETLASAMAPPVEELLHPNTTIDRSDPESALALGPEYCAPVGQGSLFFDASLISYYCVYLPYPHHYAGVALTKGLIPRFQMTTTTSWWRRPHTARWRMTRSTMR